MMLGDTTFRESVRMVLESAIASRREEDEIFQARILADMGDSTAVILLDLSSDESKEISLKMARAFMLWMGVDRYVIISESWASVRSSLRDLAESPRPSEDPQRRELMVAVGVSREEKVMMSSEMLRDGDILSFDEIEEHVGSKNIGGVFPDLLPPLGATENIPDSIARLMEAQFGPRPDRRRVH